MYQNEALNELKKRFLMTAESVIKEVFKKNGFLFFPTYLDLQNDPRVRPGKRVNSRRFKDDGKPLPSEPSDFILLQEVYFRCFS